MSNATSIQPADAGETRSGSSGRANYALLVLLLAYVFSIMDRQILTLLVGPIQQALNVNDAWMGMLHGFTFAALYSLVGLPIARLIDRSNRRLIIATGIAVWCIATAAGGLATEFWHLLVARIGVAAGEAVLLPGAVSLISDLFPGNKRDRALGVFGAGGPVGAGIGLFATGLVLGYFTAHPLTLPYLGTLEPWQTTLMSIGIPGLLLLALMIGVPEPRRDRTEPGTLNRKPDKGVPLQEVVNYFKAHRRTIGSVVLATGCYYAAVYGSTAWVPSYLVRQFGWSYADAGTAMGLMMCICAPLGVLGASWLGGFWRRRGLAHGNLRVAILASMALPVFATFVLLAPSVAVALAFLVLTAAVWTCLFGVGPAMMVEITPAPMRGQAIALFTGVLNLLGAGVGPLMVGIITDYVFGDPLAIRYSILIVTLTACALSAVLYRNALESYQHTARQAAGWLPRDSLEERPEPAND